MKPCLAADRSTAHRCAQPRTASLYQNETLPWIAKLGTATQGSATPGRLRCLNLPFRHDELSERSLARWPEVAKPDSLAGGVDDLT